MNIVELKAAAYDALVRIEQEQRQLQEINKLIAEQLEKENAE